VLGGAKVGPALLSFARTCLLKTLLGLPAFCFGDSKRNAGRPYFRSRFGRRARPWLRWVPRTDENSGENPIDWSGSAFFCGCRLKAGCEVKRPGSPAYSATVNRAGPNTKSDAASAWQRAHRLSRAWRLTMPLASRSWNFQPLGPFSIT
jgi:hypothetical protein